MLLLLLQSPELPARRRAEAVLERTNPHRYSLFSIESEVGKGTRTTATYHTDHFDMLPLGDINATILSLISVNPQLDFLYRREIDGKSFELDTREIRVILEGVPLNSPEVLTFLKEYLAENDSELNPKQ